FDALKDLGLDTTGCLDPEGAVAQERNRDNAGRDETAKALGDEREQARKLELAGERVADLVQRLELVRPAGCRLVEARVLDRDRRLRGEELRQLLVLLGELAALLLGQVEVAVRHAAKENGHAEEGAHRRVAGREADRPRIVRELLQPQRFGVSDQ